MRIEELMRWDGPGTSIIQICDRCPDKTATLADLKEALKWAEVDGRAVRYGNYWWRASRASNS